MKAISRVFLRIWTGKHKVEYIPIRGGPEFVQWEIAERKEDLVGGMGK